MNDYIVHPVRRYKATVYLTLRELAYSLTQLPSYAEGEMPRNAKLASFIKTFYQANATSAEYTFWDDSNSTFRDYVADVLNMLGNRYGDRYVCAFGYDDEDSEKAEAVEKAGYLILGALDATYDRYAPVLKYYKDKETALYSQIQSTAIASARFNDTPQDEGDYSAENFTSSITQTSSTTMTDGDSPIRRIYDIRRYWRNVLKEWCDELSACTIAEENL